MRTRMKTVVGILAKKQRTAYISLYPTGGARKQELQTRPAESVNCFRPPVIADMIVQDVLRILPPKRMTMR